MSDTENELPTEQVRDTDNPADESTVDAAPRSSNTLGWLAVLLSLTALCIVGYEAFNDWRSVDDTGQLDSLSAIDELREQVARSNETIATLNADVDQIQSLDFKKNIETLHNDVGRQLELVGSLPARMATLENSVASLAGISAGARETFLLAEAEYYMQIANAQLQLASNPELAALALKMADERVTQVSDPALIDVRSAISDELTALDVMEKPDLVGTTITLASLSRAIDSLPLASSTQPGDDHNGNDSTDKSGAERAWQTVKDAMGGLVKVTPPDQAKLALISPDAEFFLRNNIAMQLQAARIALLRGEHEIFEQALTDSDNLLERYFDASSKQVGNARATIGEIQATVFTAAAPDISGSLRLLRQFNTLRETAE